MLPVDDLAACVVLAAALAALVRGGYNVAIGGFVFTALGALILAVLISFVLSAVSTIALQYVAASSTMEGSLVFMRAALAGVAQPTLSGVAMLGTILVVGYGCARIHDAVETITILLQSHKVVAEHASKK